ncbi:MAG: long-chain fatty acid--CoA ligase [Armatimonadetes bacterium]|nr:long-chain fatty acid--CoA ligase [Armatimonadota bacterium]
MTEQQTLPALLLESCRHWGSKPALWHRVKREFQPVTYDELLRRVHGTAAGLATCGVKAGTKVAVMSENCLEWALVDWAALSMGAVVVPLYPTLMPAQIAYILKDSGATVAFAGDLKLAKRMEEAVQEEGLETLVIVMGGNPDGHLSLNRILEDGKSTAFSMDTWREGCRLVRPDDLATIIYTSGTTGEPKGAMLTHRALTFVCYAVTAALPIDQNDRFLSFLPLSHVYERTAGHFLPISCGAEIYYAQSLRTLMQDIISARPTVMLTVPRFLDSVRNKITSAAEDSPGFKKRLFHALLKRGRDRLKNDFRPVGMFGGLLDRLVGRRVRERFGGELRFFASGGAALPPDLAEFYGAFGILILQGYGLTETSAVVSINHPARSRYDSVGEVVRGVEVRIADDGEILTRGPAIMTGYHSKPEETKEALDEEGWFHTGDIGRMEGKRLWITDRKKDIIVLANGKNVAPAGVEACLKSSHYIEEALVIGDGMEYIAALIVPMFESLKRFCQEQGLDASHQGEMIEYPEVKELFRQEVHKANATIPDYERVKRHCLVPERWTQQTGELTPTLKVKRAVIHGKYAGLIASLQ